MPQATLENRRRYDRRIRARSHGALRRPVVDSYVDSSILGQWSGSRSGRSVRLTRAPVFYALRYNSPSPWPRDTPDTEVVEEVLQAEAHDLRNSHSVVGSGDVGLCLPHLDHSALNASALGKLRLRDPHRFPCLP